MNRHTLDARGLLCPLPVIRVQDFVQGLPPGDLVEVTATDPGALNDVPAWCRINGHRVISAEENDKEVKITIEVGLGS